jgi:hypothetical protein
MGQPGRHQADYGRDRALKRDGIRALGFLIFGKPLHTFPDHALGRDVEIAADAGGDID